MVFAHDQLIRLPGRFKGWCRKSQQLAISEDAINDFVVVPVISALTTLDSRRPTDRATMEAVAKRSLEDASWKET